jgi:hypothetical protein
MNKPFIKKETEAAKMLIVQLRAMGFDNDEVVVHDAIEGETNLFEAISDAVKRVGEMEANVKANKEYRKELSERAERMEKNAEAMRAAIGVALETAGVKSIPTPFGTAGISAGQAKLIITEEADVPAKFWVPRDPELDKSALKKALKDGESVPGAYLGNGSTVVTIRRK